MSTVLNVIHDLDALVIREDDGFNSDRAGHIKRLLSNVHAEPRNPYCAATVSSIWLEASGKLPDFASASSQAIKRWFEQHDRLSTDPQDILRWKGCIAGWTDVDDTNHGHVFTVTGRLTEGGKLLAISTFEGNTFDPAGTGIQGCYRRKRLVPISDKHRLWFCNTTDLPAGNYW